MQRIPLTLSLYLGRQFLIQAMIVLGVMASLILVMDIVELLRRSSGREAVSFGAVLQMAFFKLPFFMQRVLPFSMLIGGIMGLTKLTKSQELIVARAAGVSVWQFMMPSMAVAFGIGLLTLAVINPITAVMLSRYETLESQYFSGRASMLAVSKSGLWLRQAKDPSIKNAEETIVHAMRITPKNMVMHDVVIFTFAPDDSFVKRADAKTAILREGFWDLSDAIITMPGVAAEHHKRYTLPTQLTINQIQDSFAPPETLSFWELPSFISKMEESGFSALRHRLYWQSLLVMPVFLCAMVMSGAIFSLKPHRMGGIGKLFATGVFVGFVIYFTTDLVGALALSGTLPIAAAAWSIPSAALLIAIFGLLHLEDG